MYKIPRRRKEIERKNYLIMKRQFERANRPVFLAAEEAETPDEAVQAVQRFDTRELRKGIERIHEISARDGIERALQGFRQPATPPPTIIKTAKDWAELQSADDLFAEYIQIQNQTIGQKIVEIRNSHKEYLTLVVNRQIQDGFAQGLSFQEIKRNILRADKLGEYVGADGDYRVRRIVATETTMASNSASLMVAEQLNDTVPMYKEWNTIVDGKARTNHVAMNGVKVPMKDKFVVPRTKGGSEEANIPGDPNLSAENVIWCRCYPTYGELEGATGVTTPTAPPPAPKMPPIPKPPKVRPKPVKPKPSANDFSFKPEGKARFDKPFDHQYGNINAIHEAPEELQKMFEKEGLEVLRKELGNNIRRADMMKQRIQAIERLFAEWDVSKSRGRLVTNKVSISFESNAEYQGVVQLKTGKDRKGYISYNGGDRTKAIGVDVSPDGEAISWDYWNDKWDPYYTKYSTFVPRYEQVSTTTHEFAHFITSDWRIAGTMSDEAEKFWKEVEKVRNRYIGELNDLLQKAQTSEAARKRVNEIYLGKYAEHVYDDGAIDEFWAESFKNYYLSAKPSPYAEELVEIGRKYFGKKQ